MTEGNGVTGTLVAPNGAPAKVELTEEQKQAREAERIALEEELRNTGIMAVFIRGENRKEPRQFEVRLDVPIALSDGRLAFCDLAGVAHAFNWGLVESYQIMPWKLVEQRAIRARLTQGLTKK